MGHGSLVRRRGGAGRTADGLARDAPATFGGLLAFLRGERNVDGLAVLAGDEG